MGVLSTTGVLSVTGRVKELYKLENGKYVVPSPIEGSLTMSRFVAQALLIGANLPHNSALIVVDAAACAPALKAPVGSTTADLLATHGDALHNLVCGEIDARCAEDGVKRYAVPKAFTILAEEFTVDNGMLTPKLSMKRHVIEENLAAEIAAMYES
jgi:long-chain acyl-CoA synthetase